MMIKQMNAITENQDQRKGTTHTHIILTQLNIKDGLWPYSKKLASYMQAQTTMNI